MEYAFKISALPALLLFTFAHQIYSSLRAGRKTWEEEGLNRERTT